MTENIFRLLTPPMVGVSGLVMLLAENQFPSKNVTFCISYGLLAPLLAAQKPNAILSLTPLS